MRRGPRLAGLPGFLPCGWPGVDGRRRVGQRHRDGGLTLDVTAALAWRGAAQLGHPGFVELATAAGMPARELARNTIVWWHGGTGALRALHTGWQPDPDELAEGTTVLDADPAPPLQSRSGRAAVTRDWAATRSPSATRWPRVIGLLAP